MLNKHLLHQIKKFAIVGATSTSINYAVFYLLFRHGHLYYLLASALGFISGLFFSYAFNRLWTFESVMEHKGKEFFAYAAVCIFSMLVSLGALRFEVDVLHINPLFANLAAIGISAASNFIILKFTVFKPKASGQNSLQDSII